MRHADRLLTSALAALTLGLGACDQQGAYGDPNSIVAIASAELWEQVEDTVYSALEPTIWTVRDEKAFTVTWGDPEGPTWADLSRFQQLLLIGPASAPHIGEALSKRTRATGDDPTLVQVNNVWARGQQVTVLITPEEGQAEAVVARLGALHEIYDRQYRAWATSRMFVSGRDTALADTLAREAGFSITVPGVYYWDRQDSVYLFRNDNPDPSELIRQVMVTWMSPAPQGMDGEILLAWRQDVAEAYYQDDQVAVLENARAEALQYQGLEAYQIQAVWQAPPTASWPAAGPFILRAVLCPAQDRLYLLDAWLYAPGKEKYEYMIQLETILDSFSCEV